MSLTLTMLQEAYRGPSASKRMARDAGVSHRTTEKWWARLRTPPADILLRMARENHALREQMLRALAGDDYDEIFAVGRAAAQASGAPVASPCGPGEGPARGGDATIADEAAVIR